jgi:hypothetical protein
MIKLNNNTVAYGRLIVVIVALAIGIIVVATSWQRSQPQDLILRFHPYVGDKPLVLNSQSYNNPGGEGQFTIRDFQLFISNITVDYPASRVTEQESYHLLRFDSSASFGQIVVPQIKLQNLKRLSFAIGIDPKANGSLIIAGDLDPNSRMAWNWQVGYKFLLLEGTLTVASEQLPLVYHIGFDQSYTKLNFDLSNKNLDDNGVINFKIDLLRLFEQDDINYIDMVKLNNVKFAPDDVKLIAKGFTHFIRRM